jgi:excisionase family DNA binding protein
MPEDWLSLSEVAEQLGVHPGTVRNWTRQGQIPFHRTQGGHRRFKRNEVELWLNSQQDSGSAEAALIVQDALRRTRLKISEGSLEAESWYIKLDQDAREKYRQSGRHLMQGMVTYLASDEKEANAEARSLGYEYATRGRSYELNISETTRALLFFRNALLDALFSVYKDAAIRSPLLFNSMFQKINAFTDEILITLMETYQAFERSKNG